jgi:hypothetical protein
VLVKSRWSIRWEADEVVVVRNGMAVEMVYWTYRFIFLHWDGLLEDLLGWIGWTYQSWFQSCVGDALLII